MYSGGPTSSSAGAPREEAKRGNYFLPHRSDNFPAQGKYQANSLTGAGGYPSARHTIVPPFSLNREDGLSTLGGLQKGRRPCICMLFVYFVCLVL